MPDEVLDGFDHTQYRDEVVARWGRDDYERADRWWRSLDAAERERFQRTQDRIAKDYAAALLDGKPAASDEAQAITKRHVEWLSAARTPSKEYVLGLAELYVTDPRFAENYERHAAGTAVFVRDAIAVYAERELG